MIGIVKLVGKFLLFVFCFLFFKIEVYANTCSSEELVRLRTLSNYIEITNDYVEVSDSYLVTIAGLTEELFVYNKSTYQEYRYSDMVEGSVSFSASVGEYRLEIYPVSCDVNRALRTVNLELLKFNPFSKEEECKDLEEYQLDFCDPWYQGEMNLDIFLEKIEPYYLVEEESTVIEETIDILEKYWYVALVGGILFILLIVFLIIRRRKRSVLE